MAKLKVNPWLDIWIRPRETIRAIVNYNPKYQFVLLSFIYGFPMLLHIYQNLSLGEQYSTFLILIGAIILAPFIGMLGITIASGLIYWTGKWIGGASSYYPIRAAVSWSNVPNVVGIILWLVLIAAFKREVFMDDFTNTSFMGTEMVLVFSVFLLQTTISIWSFIILLKGLGEVQGFSAWKALLNVLIPFFMVGIAIWLISWLIWAANGMPTAQG